MKRLRFRRAEFSDAKLYFKWLNDPQVRDNSFYSSVIKWEDHVKWFESKISDPNYFFCIFQNQHDEFVGQVRIQKINESNSLIGISICIDHRGQGYGESMIIDACNNYFKSCPEVVINAFIKNDNKPSKKIFEKAGFQLLNNLLHNDINTDHYILYANR